MAEGTTIRYMTGVCCESIEGQIILDRRWERGWNGYGASSVRSFVVNAARTE